jgi:hypothetical protein
MDETVALVDVHVAGLGRTNGFFQQLEGLGAPADDINLLAVEFLNDVSDAGTTGTVATGAVTASGIVTVGTFLALTAGTATIAAGVVTATASIMTLDTNLDPSYVF